MSSQPIDCLLHDYLEIVCLFHYDVRFTLRDRSTVEGRAVTTRTLPNKVEVIELNVESQPVPIAMHEISRLDVLTENARFQFVNFGGEQTSCSVLC